MSRAIKGGSEKSDCYSFFAFLSLSYSASLFLSPQTFERDRREPVVSLILFNRCSFNLCFGERLYQKYKTVVALQSGQLRTLKSISCIIKTFFVVFNLPFRAIHTNYDAKFTCDSIKLAVIKNRWLAQRLGGDMYSVVFRYEQGQTSSIWSYGSWLMFMITMVIVLGLIW